MIKQERAVRTRAAFIKAAAELFDHHGYHATSLAQVSRAAGHSMGALTFHFSSKHELADHIAAEGRHRLTAVLDSLRAVSESPLDKMVRLSAAFADLLDTDCMLRASMTLAHDRKQNDLLAELWLPAIGRLVEQAFAEGRIAPSISRGDVCALAEHLMRGASACRGPHLTPAGSPIRSAETLTRLWMVALAGLSVLGTGRIPDETAQGRLLTS
ncbi:TetR family transcriptional regulator [Streptomyces sp. NPDC091879]|uniref:TetR family transcriptional regulator n=1 Tax=Streptomyces sp. NPDC091879 TaxID=3366006 RepID=UPI0037F4CD0B